MVFVTQDQSGLQELIPQLGGLLGEVLQKRNQQSEQAQMSQALASQFGPDTTLGKILSQPRGLELFEKLAPYLQPLFTGDAKRQGDQSLASAQKSFFSPQEVTQETISIPGYGNVSETQIARALQDPRDNIRKWGEGAQKALVDVKEKQEDRRKSEGFLENISDLRSLLPYTGTTTIPGTTSFAAGGPMPWNREGLQKREEFDVLAFSLEGFLRELSSKGTLPQRTFEELLKKLPNSKLSERQNIGRLDAIEKTIKRTSLPKEEGSNRLNKVTKGTLLSDRDVAKKIFEESGRDPIKAIQYAEKLGYKVELK